MSTGGGTLDILFGLPEPIVRYPATPAVPVRYPATAGLSDMNRSCLWSLYEAHTEEDSRILLTWENREVRVTYRLHTIFLPTSFALYTTRLKPGSHMLPVLPATPFPYENGSRLQQRPCQSLPPARLRSWLEFNFAGMPAVKTSDVSCCRRR